MLFLAFLVANISAQGNPRDFSSPGEELKDPETYDEFYDLANAFIDGANLIQFLPNIEDCSKYSQIYLNDQNATDIYLKETKDMEAYDYLRNLTQIVSNQFAEAYLYCHMTVVDGYVYYLE